MENHQLIDYIQKRTSEGAKKEQIEQELISVGGWTKEDIDGAFSKLFFSFSKILRFFPISFLFLTIILFIDKLIFGGTEIVGLHVFIGLWTVIISVIVNPIFLIIYFGILFMLSYLSNSIYVYIHHGYMHFKIKNKYFSPITLFIVLIFMGVVFYFLLSALLIAFFFSK